MATLPQSPPRGDPAAGSSADGLARTSGKTLNFAVPDANGGPSCDGQHVATYLLAHRHAASECRVVFAAWTGFASPLRHRSAWASCFSGGHQLWWTVEADDADAALAYLPGYVACRTEAIAVRAVTIP